MLKMYGIKNCDTIKKARHFLGTHSITYCFHDYRIDGIDLPLINQFIQLIDYKNLLNTRGLTWRNLSDDEKTQALNDKTLAIQLMLKNPTIIKRPLLLNDNQCLLGFSIESYEQFIKENQL